ncbi:MAG: hypothetical protein DRP60_06775 [Spirochaetes bacterium]|nr:MAG: hypothetical protein DRP60_06775 [Spirochaetota bacterium]
MLIYEAFGWKLPAYCHLPMVMGKDGQKLSKRHGSTSVSDFRKNGYLPEALVNFVSLLGWSYDDSREFFSMEDLCSLFSLEKINKSPAVFDYRKLDWFNGQYLRMKDPDELKGMLLPLLAEEGLVSDPPTPGELDIFNGAFPIIRERLKLLNDVVPMLRFLFTDPGIGNAEDAIPKKMDASEAAKALGLGEKLLMEATDAPGASDEEACAAWDEVMDGRFRETAEKEELKIGAMLQPLRLAVTASKVSPPLFPAIRLLGLEESLKRIKRLIGVLENM